MIVINQRRQQPSKECALLMGELLRPGDTSKRLLKSWHRRLLNLPTSSYSQTAPSAFDAVMFTDPLPLKYGTGLSKAAGYYHFIPSHAFWTFLWQFLNPSWTVEQFADLASFPRWMQVLLLPLARGNKYTVKKRGFLLLWRWLEIQFWGQNMCPSPYQQGSLCSWACAPNELRFAWKAFTGSSFGMRWQVLQHKVQLYSWVPVM